MGEPRIADDFAFIAGRLKELEGQKPSPGGKWGVWFIEGRKWCHVKKGRNVHIADAAIDMPASLFDSEIDAMVAVKATNKWELLKDRVVLKPYLETLT